MNSDARSVGRHRIDGAASSKLVQLYGNWRLKHAWWDRFLTLIMFLAVLSAIGQLVDVIF